MKGPLGIWVSLLNDKESGINIGTLGCGYFLKTKKWDLALLTEKSFYDKNYKLEDLSESDEVIKFNDLHDYFKVWCENEGIDQKKLRKPISRKH